MNITPELFEQQSKHRFGTTNPERMRIDVWEWMVRHGDSAWGGRKAVGLENVFTPGAPDWCFERFGMSRTAMSDGRIICIGGEHEDFYDPDYCIYNDVIVLRPAAGAVEVTLDSGEVEIYGYPETIFPPTDFHSATLVGDVIYLIGRLGYDGTRTQDITPVFKLDTKNYTIEEVKTAGTCLGWLYEHFAAFDSNRQSITVWGGYRKIKDETSKTVNRWSHRLYLEDMHWEAVANRIENRRYELEAIDTFCDDLAPENFRPRSVPHIWLPAEKHVYPTYRIDLSGICVTFDCIGCGVEVSIEGDLPQDIVDRVLKEVVENISASTGVEWRAEECPKE